MDISKYKAVKDASMPADRCWVCVDTSEHEAPGPYVVDGYPVVTLPHEVELWSEAHQRKVRQVIARRFWPRKRDVLTVLARLAEQQK